MLPVTRTKLATRPGRPHHGPRLELRSSRPFRRPPSLVDRRRMGRHHPRRAPVRAPGARRAVRRRLHPRRPRVGPRKQLLQRELGVEPSAFVLVYTPDTLTAGTPEWLAAVAAATRTSPPPRTSPACSATCWRPTRSAPTATRRTTSCSSTCRRTTPPTPSRPVASRLHEAPGLAVGIGGGPAFYGDVQAVTERDLRRSELISFPLAGARPAARLRQLVAAGVPLAVGGAAVVVALAGIFVVASFVADEHLRAQPRDAPRPRARRGLLAAPDEPVPRGAREASATDRDRPWRRPSG